MTSAADNRISKLGQTLMPSSQKKGSPSPSTIELSNENRTHVSASPSTSTSAAAIHSCLSLAIRCVARLGETRSLEKERIHA